MWSTDGCILRLVMIEVWLGVGKRSRSYLGAGLRSKEDRDY